MDIVFISYRREDSEGFACSLFQSLVGRFGKDHVFMDVEAIGLGMDFVDPIDSSLADCGALLVLIGKEWVGCTDEQGRRRLEKEDDLVRTELAKAIERNVRVIPILVKGAQMPKADELPEELRSLTRRQALELRHERWDHDVDHLATALEQALGLQRIDTPKPAPPPISEPPPPSAKPKRSRAMRYVLIMIAGLAVLGVIIYNSVMNSLDEYVESNLSVTPTPSASPTPAPTPAPTAKPSAKPTRTTSITGYWIDVDGAQVEIVQTSTTAVSQAIDPATGILIQANWGLNGRNFEFNWFAASGNRGYGRGGISSDYNSIQYEAVDYVTGIQDTGQLTRAAR
jgi:hypothetical protein